MDEIVQRYQVVEDLTFGEILDPFENVMKVLSLQRKMCLLKITQAYTQF